MAIPPHLVTAPLKRLKGHTVVHTTADWSLATGLWDGHRSLLIRWNGSVGQPLGNPVSHANPTWFVLPPDLWASSLSVADDQTKAHEASEWLNDA